MANYFDTSDAADTGLLHPSIKTHADLSRVASAAEYDVIQAFTFKVNGAASVYSLQASGIQSSATENPYFYPTEDFVVYLNGFKPDADDSNTSALLKDALRRTIADVITHRLFNIDSAGGNVIEEQRGRRRIKYAEAKDADWPDNWDQRLATFDLRPKYRI